MDETFLIPNAFLFVCLFFFGADFSNYYYYFFSLIFPFFSLFSFLGGVIKIEKKDKSIFLIKNI